jgi:thiol-disulfide isomerase/thioredoxin
MFKLKVLPIFILAVSVLFGCGGTQEKSKEEQKQVIPIVDFSAIKPLLEKNNDTTYLINFWATWCAPCVKELPYFEKIAEELSDKKFKVILVNLDFPSHYETRLLPFVEEKGIKSTIIVLDDPDANRWINEVDSRWTGAIPATVIYNKNKRKFFEKEFTYDDLKNEVLELLN